MLQFTRATIETDLQGILRLQQENLVKHLPPTEAKEQGFLTVQHSYPMLKALNDVEQHVIAKDGDTVAAYVLAMTQVSRHEIPMLLPMFELFDVLPLHHKTVNDYRYMGVGQVCVGKAYRGQGVFEAIYKAYQNCFSKHYDFAITEVATRNTRSMKAHQRIGFQELSRYTAPDQVEWSVVWWDWK